MLEVPAAKFYKRGDPLHVRAQQIWMILISHVESQKEYSKNPITTTYGRLAEKMGMSSKAGVTLGRQLGLIAYFCIENNLPMLNSIVVNERGTPGDECPEAPGGFRDEQKRVLDYSWFEVRVPTTGTFRKVRDWSAETRSG